MSNRAECQTDWIQIRLETSLDPDQARHVGPDLDPNSLQRLSADNTGR